MEKKPSWEEALVQFATNMAQYRKNITSSIQVLVVQIGEIATMLANMTQGSSLSNPEKEPTEQEEEIIMEQQ